MERGIWTKNDKFEGLDMKYAIIKEERREAEKGLSHASCIGCGQAMIPKCGETNIHHWAHLGKRMCDHWWEPETEWHRAWKNQFPKDWQERVQFAEDGEKHIADVKTDQDWVLEFQHSFLKPEERRARNFFYNKIVWIVNGNRRERDKAKFFKVIAEDGRPFSTSPLTHKLWVHDCKLFEEWINPNAAVFFDFGDDQTFWCLVPSHPDMYVYVIEVSKSRFLDIHTGNFNESSKDFGDHIRDLINSISTEISDQRIRREQEALRNMINQRTVHRPRRHFRF